MSVEMWKELSIKELEMAEASTIEDGVQFYNKAQQLRAQADYFEGSEIRTKMVLWEMQAYIEERRKLEAAHEPK